MVSATYREALRCATITLLKMCTEILYESEEHSFLYRDPSFNWQEQHEGSLVIQSHDIPVDRVSEVAMKVNNRIDHVRDLIGLKDIPDMKEMILNSRQEANSSFPMASYAARRGHFREGFALVDLDIFVVVGLNVGSRVHEIAHLFLHEAVDFPFARVPAWLNEGLATYFETSAYCREFTVTSAVGRGALTRLRAMNTVALSR